MLTRSVSVADHLVMKLVTTAGKPSPIKAQAHVDSTVNVLPLKREEGAGRLPWGQSRYFVTEGLQTLSLFAAAR
jgi:hypothetical protein